MLYPKGTTHQTPESLAVALDFIESVIMSVETLAPVGQRFAYIEKPLVGRGGILATVKQSYVGGILRACLAKHSFQVFDAHPASWRKALGIKGKDTIELKAATRQYISASMPKVIGRLGSDGDLTDAAAICAYGLGLQSSRPT